MKYKELDIEDFSKLKFLRKYLTGHKGFIAGGCFKNIFNNEQIKDIDIFFKNLFDYKEAVNHFKGNSDYVLHYQNNKVIAYKNKETGMVLELIKQVYGDEEDTLNVFDFSITKMAYTAVYNVDDMEWEEQLICHPEYFQHLHLKRLVIDGKLTKPFNTFERALRYKDYGYSLCKYSKVKLIEGIRNEEIFEVDDLNNSLYDGLD